MNSKIVKDCLAAAAVVEATGEGARALARWPEAGEARKERKEGRKEEKGITKQRGRSEGSPSIAKRG